MKRKLQDTESVKNVACVLTGDSLQPEDLFEIGQGNVCLTISEAAWARIRSGRQVVEDLINGGGVAHGINTGCGLFDDVVIPNDKLRELQENLVRSHAAGTGPLISRERTRMLFALRLNVLAKGFSGISEATLRAALAAFHKDCMPAVPSKGSVGASGDLAPLAHLALGLMGEGQMWDPKSGELGQASEIMAREGIAPLCLTGKEGLALINGTQLITSLGCEAVVRARNVCNVADICCALTLETLKGTPAAFHPKIHESRPHRGQIRCASRLRALLQPARPSELFQSHNYKGRVQDAYSLRCAPQVHGICCDTVEFVSDLITREMNSATDSPMVFTEEAAWEMMRPPVAEEESSRLEEADIKDLDTAQEEIARLKHLLAATKTSGSQVRTKRASDTFYAAPSGGFIVSGGNFHGEYPAKALDFLAIGVHELSAISERRIERLVNPTLSGLPAFLVPQGGLNSGFMIAHCTAASLVSENKVLCHPASVDSISTSAAKEDHVSMGGFSARKALEVVTHVETVLAIELLAGCQALDLLRPLRTTPALELVYDLVRTVTQPWNKDREMAPDIEAVRQLIKSGKVYETVRRLVEPIMQAEGLEAAKEAKEKNAKQKR